MQSTDDRSAVFAFVAVMGAVRVFAWVTGGGRKNEGSSSCTAPTGLVVPACSAGKGIEIEAEVGEDREEEDQEDGEHGPDDDISDMSPALMFNGDKGLPVEAVDWEDGDCTHSDELEEEAIPLPMGCALSPESEGNCGFDG